MPHGHYLWRNSRFSIPRECVGAIVHDTLVIIADTIIGDSAIAILVEVMLLTCKSALKFYSCVIQEQKFHSKNSGHCFYSDINGKHQNEKF